ECPRAGSSECVRVVELAIHSSIPAQPDESLEPPAGWEPLAREFPEIAVEPSAPMIGSAALRNQHARQLLNSAGLIPGFSKYRHIRRNPPLCGRPHWFRSR